MGAPGGRQRSSQSSWGHGLRTDSQGPSLGPGERCCPPGGWTLIHRPGHTGRGQRGLASHRLLILGRWVPPAVPRPCHVGRCRFCSRDRSRRAEVRPPTLQQKLGAVGRGSSGLPGRHPTTTSHLKRSTAQSWPKTHAPNNTDPAHGVTPHTQHSEGRVPLSHGRQVGILGDVDKEGFSTPEPQTGRPLLTPKGSQ